MKKTPLLFLIIFSIIAIYFFNLNRSSSIEDNFAFEEINLISKVFLADRKGNTINLQKTATGWIVNEKYIVRKDVIDLLLSTIQEVKVQRTVSNAQFNTVIKNLATTGVKIEIYTTKKDPVKVYTIGGSTQNHLGTFMLMYGSENPFITHIPGFNGFLSPRYGIQANEININTWRETKVFNLEAKNITKISIIHLQDSLSSFEVVLGDASKNPVLLNNNQEVVLYNQKKMSQFINNFNRLNCESFKSDKEDRLKNNPPLHIILVTHHGKTDTLRTYLLAENLHEKNPEYNFNVERMYATLNNQELMLIQGYVFNKVLITLNELEIKN